MQFILEFCEISFVPHEFVFLYNHIISENYTLRAKNVEQENMNVTKNNEALRYAKL